MTELDKAERANYLASLDVRTEEEQAELDALTEELTTPAPAAQGTPDLTPETVTTKAAPRRGRKKADTEPEVEGVRYAAFNKSLGRYEGGVRETRADAENVASKAAQGGRYVVEVREIK